MTNRCMVKLLSNPMHPSTKKPHGKLFVCKKGGKKDHGQWQLTVPKLNESASLVQRFVALFQLMIQTPEVRSLEIVSPKLKR